jgi:hypothetical protein
MLTTSSLRKTTTVSADFSPSSATGGTSGPSDFARAAMAILATMVLLIVALTGILVETTWHNHNAAVEALPPDPGSFARR